MTRKAAPIQHRLLRLVSAVVSCVVFLGSVRAEHWSFELLSDVRVPRAGSSDAWCRNPIDAFVLERLQQESLEPSPPARKEVLLRRLSLDLTGLPPSAADIDAFVNDSSANAYEKVVDRLLASPAYGERMALVWMDAARYGDTSALNADGVREMWPWRDWVINAYNANKPFDKFLVEQLAGDLLPDPTLDQLVATGFNRNNGTSDENGAIAEELRVNYVVDRVQTTFNVFQGLSMECAQCHDHFYDPISQEDYYRVFAFFNNMRDPGLQTREGNQPPLVHLPDSMLAEKLAEIDLQIARLEREFAEASPTADAIARWAAEAQDSGDELLTATDWYVLGDFCDGTLDHVFTPNQYQPRNAAPNVSDTAGEFVWKKVPKWWDGEPNRTWMTRNSARYYYRKIHVSSHHSATLRLAGADAFRVWLNGAKVELDQQEKDEDRLSVSSRLNLQPGDNHLVIKLGAKKNGHFEIEFALDRRLIREDVASAVTPELADYFKHHVWDLAAEYRARRRALAEQRDGLLAEATSTMVMGDREQLRPTFLLERGQYDLPSVDDVILPDLPEVFSSLPESAPRNRLGLARWMVSAANPLTARVAVNRYWSLLFGKGLVRTPMDFGVQGQSPTHPELLDWLAGDFVASKWNVKRMIKQIVMSATYRQSSRWDARVADRDPTNQLLARQSRHRLAAEFIRDHALASSGLLVQQVGGPSVKPYQPPGLWKDISDEGKLRYERDKGSKLYRRGVYVYWKRSSPHPGLSTFDAPNRETCQVGRLQTNTPLQALVMLNDETYVEAARMLAQRMIRDGGSEFASRVAFGYRLCTSRLPKQEEIAILARVFDQQLASLRSEPDRAQQFLSHGDATRDTTINACEHAAWTVIAQLLLNLDESLNRE